VARDLTAELWPATQCYAASEALYHRLGGKVAGFTPMVIEHEGVKHWYLRWNTPHGPFYLDPSVKQFRTPVPYEKGRGCGFLTKAPSKKARRFL